MIQKLFGQTIGFNESFLNFVEIEHAYKVLAQNLLGELKEELKNFNLL